MYITAIYLFISSYLIKVSEFKVVQQLLRGFGCINSCNCKEIRKDYMICYKNFNTERKRFTTIIHFQYVPSSGITYTMCMAGSSWYKWYCELSFTWKVKIALVIGPIYCWSLSSLDDSYRHLGQWIILYSLKCVTNDKNDTTCPLVIEN